VLTDFTLTVTTVIGTRSIFAKPQKTALSHVDNAFVLGETYTIAVTGRGDTYLIYINGATTPLATLGNSDYPQGQVGLYDDQPNTITGSGLDGRFHCHRALTRPRRIPLNKICIHLVDLLQ
jgi:hypothetical protein